MNTMWCGRWVSACAGLLGVVSSSARADLSPPTYRIRATVTRTAPQLSGTVETAVRNTTSQPLRDIVVVLFANRFATAAADDAVNDANRPYVYPREEFEAGGMTIDEVRVDGLPVQAQPTAVSGLPEGCVMTLALPTPIRPGERRDVSMRFTTTVPRRFGSFGEFDEMLTAVGGWYPYIPALQADGSWATGAPPPLSDFDVQLSADSRLEVLVNGQQLPGLSEPAAVTVHGAHYLTVIAAPLLLRDTIDADGMRIVGFRRPPFRADRRAPGPSQLDITLDTLRRVVTQRPAGVPVRDELVVVEAPLRLNLAAPAEGMVVISDRTLKVLWVLRPFHEAQLAQAVYTELLRPQVARREMPGDYPWVGEGLAHQRAREQVLRANPDTRSVQD